MIQPTDDILVGYVRLPYSQLPEGWLTPDGTVIYNPLRARRIAEEFHNRSTLH